MTGRLLGVLLVSLVFAALKARAQQSDMVAQNLLIEKLEKVYQTLAPADPSKVPVTMRLADLYADRARVASMGDGCKGCPSPEGDRAKALRLYNEIIDRAPEAAKSKISLQVGHLYQLNGQEDKAINFYQRNLADAKDPSVRTETHLALGEIFFKRHNLAKAIVHYDEVLKSSRSGSKGLAAYRHAWAVFNLGKVSQATEELRKILTSPELLQRSGPGQVDRQFQEDVSRDYASFLSKDTVNKEKIESLYSLSPETIRVANTQALAADLERVGRRDESLLAWEFVLNHLSDPQSRLTAHMSLAQIYLDKGLKAEALKHYEMALEPWGEIKFKDMAAETEQKRRARNFLVAWNQTEKKAPSEELASAYGTYLKKFPKDLDAQLYAAQIGTERKDWAGAWQRYGLARDLILSPEGKDKKVDQEKLETVLLSQLEVAESSKEIARVDESYDQYIKYSVKKTKLTEVKYQKARALYERGDHQKAAAALREIALSGQGTSQLRKQAADLSLDALVLAKDQDKLLAWSKDYESQFAEGKSDFANIAQKTILTQAADVAEKSPDKALAVLAGFNPSKATNEDRAKYYKNVLLLSEKQGKIKEAAAAADALANVPGVSAADHELALARKAYFAELRLDFSTAFAATEKLETTLSKEDKAFKLAVFAELSGKSSAPLYMNYISQAVDQEKRSLVAAELVRKSKTPEVEIERVKGVLKDRPALLSELYAEAYAKKPSAKIIKTVMGDAKLRDTEPGKLLQRQGFLTEFAGLKAQVVSAKLDTKNNGTLARSIKQRGVLLGKLEEMAKRAIQSGDWTSQLVSIDLLGRESERFYQELLSAPVPQGLSPEEEQEYLSLLSAQAAPYQTKASEAKTKVSQFWSTEWAKPMEASWNQVSLRGLLKNEVAALKEIAPDGERAKFDVFKENVALASRPSIQEVQTARQRVFENPMNKGAIEELLQLERRSENRAMSEYLATRLEKLNKGTL